jgi:hypothetical protein
MADTFVIVVRIVPLVPTDGKTFRSFLENLTLTAYDRTVGDTSPDVVTGKKDVELGVASGLAPMGIDQQTGQPIGPIIAITPGSNPPQYTNSIIQHYEEIITQPPQGPTTVAFI